MRYGKTRRLGPDDGAPAACQRLAEPPRLLFDGNGDAAFGDAVFLAALRTPEGYKSTDGRTGNYNSFWVAERVFENRTSLITDPPDGRKPPLTSQAEKVAATIDEMRQQPPAGAESLPLQLRCIT